MYEYEDYYEPSELDQKMEELKDYLRDSVKSELKNKLESLSKKNENLEKTKIDLNSEISKLRNENNSLKILNNASSILLNKITKDNIFEIVSILFEKTFNENTYECPTWFGILVNYYNDRYEIIELLKFAGIEIPKEAVDIVLPHEWDKGKINLFFETMHRHVNCNGNSFSDNLRHFSWKDALNPMTKNYSSYDEIPWQFVLRNPILNSLEYAEKMVIEINKGGNGQNFSKITEYQKLDDNVLSYMISNIKPVVKYKDSIVNHLLIKHIELMTDEQYIADLYKVLLNRWRPYETIAKMSFDYQTKYATTLERIDQVLEFFKYSTLSQDDKAKIASKFI